MENPPIVTMQDDALEATTEKGPVTSLVRLSPAKSKIGDTLTLTLQVQAQSSVEVLMPAFGESLDRFSILDFAPKETADANGNTTIMHQYTLQARSSGPHTIPRLMIEFVDRRAGQRPTPEDEDAYELLTDAIDFEVESVVPEGASDDLKSLQGRLDPIVRAPARNGSHWWLLGLAVVVIAAGAGYFVLSMRKRVRRRTAFDVALSRLDALTNAPRPGAHQMDAFFVELSALVRQYLEDRFGVHAPELTTEEFLDAAARSPDLTTNDRGFLQDLLANADRVKFSGFTPEPVYVDAALAAVRGFLEQTRDAKPRHQPSHRGTSWRRQASRNEFRQGGNSCLIGCRTHLH